MKYKWEDPEYRASVTASMHGKSPWNKGRSLSEETRAKMSEAKMNHKVTRTTRQKMSAARSDRPLSPEAAAIISAKLRGQPKSEEHKRNIAAAQRRRHAAIRVLKAVEFVYETSLNESDGRSGPLVASGVRAQGSSKSKRRAKSQVLGAFKSELREYRSLQEELSPWTRAFVERHGRKPSMVDVQMTGIEWLVSRYKQYIILRDRLFNESSLLRRKLNGSFPDTDGSVTGGTPGGGSQPLGSGQTTNANGPAMSARSALASRVAAVMQYKLQKKQSDASSNGTPINARPVALKPAAENKPALRNQAGAAGDNNSSKELTRNLEMAKSQAKAPRVRAAMQAAMEYRIKKAQATKATAAAAAVAANAGWHDVQLTRNDADKGTDGHSSESLHSSSDAMETISEKKSKVVSRSASASVLGNGNSGRRALPADIAQAQAAAHRALQEVRNAEAEVRRALNLNLQSESDEDEKEVRSGSGVRSKPSGAGPPAVTIAGAGA